METNHIVYKVLEMKGKKSKYASLEGNNWIFDRIGI